MKAQKYIEKLKDELSKDFPSAEFIVYNTEYAIGIKCPKQRNSDYYFNAYIANDLESFEITAQPSQSNQDDDIYFWYCPIEFFDQKDLNDAFNTFVYELIELLRNDTYIEQKNRLLIQTFKMYRPFKGKMKLFYSNSCINSKKFNYPKIDGKKKIYKSFKIV